MYEIYRSGLLRRGWRWRWRADNGKIVFGSTESYINYNDCENSIGLAKQSAKDRVKNVVYFPR